jgi:amidase
MNSVDLAFTSALEQARLIRTKVISPLELAEIYLQRIERLDGRLGSYVTVGAELAIADAQLKTEQLCQTDPADLPPFFGVPISIKDLNAVAGLPCTYGLKLLKGRIVSEDDGLVRRIRAAGFTILGKSATSEVGSLPYTEPKGMPPVRNPWNLDYTAGGSSGGAAAGLAAGLAAIAQGSDGGGSIRGPAFCCGLVGIKPSRGRISFAPVGERLHGLAVSGPLAHTVADAAALLDVMSGYVTGDPYWLPPPQPSFLAAATRSPQPLRIGFATQVLPIGAADPVCAQAVLDTAARLERLGHQVEEFVCPDFSDLIEPFTVVFQSVLSESAIPWFVLNKMNRWFLQRAWFCSCGQYLRAATKLQTLARQIVVALDAYDVVVLPIYMHPTIRVGEWATLSPAKTLRQITDWVAPCPPFNVTGQPAIALPTGFGPNHLPVGVQLVGRPAGEETLIEVAAQLERSHPWSCRPDFATMAWKSPGVISQSNQSY